MAFADIKTSIAAGLANIITDTAGTVTYNGNDYTAGHGVLDTERTYDVTGELDGYTDTWTILQSDLTTNGDAPDVGDEITTPDGVKRILRIRRDTYATCQRLDVGDRY